MMGSVAFKEDNVSVAMATYNGSKYIEEQLLSILNQTLPPKEIIIVDDNSTDNTFEILEKIQKSHSGIVLHKNETNIGPIKTFKKALAYCKFDYIALSDQDDVWKSNKIEICLAQLQQLDQNLPSIVFTDLQMIDSKGNVLEDSFWKYQNYNTSKILFKHLLFGNIVTGCTILMNSAMKREIAKMPNDVIMHDYWIALIAYSVGSFKSIEISTIKFRIHNESVTDKSKRTMFFRFKFLLGIFTRDQNNYKMENILQAESFLNIYKENLNKENLNDIVKFISLKKKHPFVRKIYVGCLKFLS